MKAMNTVTVQTAVVGKEYVLFYIYNPCRGNTKNNPTHPCRVTVTKVGRLNIKTDNNITIKPDGLFQLMEVEEAKVYYREGFKRFKNDYRTQAQIDQYVEEL